MGRGVSANVLGSRSRTRGWSPLYFTITYFPEGEIDTQPSVQSDRPQVEKSKAGPIRGLG